MWISSSSPWRLVGTKSDPAGLVWWKEGLKARVTGVRTLSEPQGSSDSHQSPIMGPQVRSLIFVSPHRIEWLVKGTDLWFVSMTWTFGSISGFPYSRLKVNFPNPNSSYTQLNHNWPFSCAHGNHDAFPGLGWIFLFMSQVINHSTHLMGTCDLERQNSIWWEILISDICVSLLTCFILIQVINHNKALMYMTGNWEAASS